MGIIPGFSLDLDAFQPLNEHIYQYIANFSKLPDRIQSPSDFYFILFFFSHKCLQPPPKRVWVFRERAETPAPGIRQLWKPTGEQIQRMAHP